MLVALFTQIILLFLQTVQTREDDDGLQGTNDGHVCAICSANVPTAQDLRAHINNAHYNDGDAFCYFQCSSKQVIWSHLRLRHFGHGVRRGDIFKGPYLGNRRRFQPRATNRPFLWLRPTQTYPPRPRPRQVRPGSAGRHATPSRRHHSLARKLSRLRLFETPSGLRPDH